MYAMIDIRIISLATLIRSPRLRLRAYFVCRGYALVLGGCFNNYFLRYSRLAQDFRQPHV